MGVKQLPVTNAYPCYQFSMTLEKKVYAFSFRYNTRVDIWIMDILDQSNNPIIMGIPLLVNQSLTNGFVTDLKPPGNFYVIDESKNESNPNRESLGLDHKLCYVESI